MRRWLLITTILFIDITHQADVWFTFRDDLSSLEECIEDFFLYTGSECSGTRAMKSVTEIVAKRLLAKTKSKNFFHNLVDKLFFNLRSGQKTHPGLRGDEDFSPDLQKPSKMLWSTFLIPAARCQKFTFLKTRHLKSLMS